MLTDDTGFSQAVRRVVTRMAANPAHHDDLMQECLIQLWRLESEEPGRTRSWYLQHCRFHILHWMGSGRSLDSLKRANGNLRVTLDASGYPLAMGGDLGHGELLGMVSARDIVSTLACQLNPRELEVLEGLADGLALNEIAEKLGLSYPTVLKYRHKIAALTIKLGIPPPPPFRRSDARRVDRVHGHPSRLKAEAGPGIGLSTMKLNRGTLAKSREAARPKPSTRPKFVFNPTCQMNQLILEGDAWTLANPAGANQTRAGGMVASSYGAGAGQEFGRC